MQVPLVLVQSWNKVDMKQHVPAESKPPCAQNTMATNSHYFVCRQYTPGPTSEPLNSSYHLSAYQATL